MLIEEIQTQVTESSTALRDVRHEMGKAVIGQDAIISRLLIAILADGHVLIEGVPGLAKTLIVSSLAASLKASFTRIQFTPDLLPADITGTLIFNQKTAEFYPKKGPIFANFILADEINRAPSKVQSALLEAMQERQVTIGETSEALPDPFFVMATQNPIEQEGTYPLPEAQIDRFMMKLLIRYPQMEEERRIMALMVDPKPIQISPVLTPEKIKLMRQIMHSVYMEEKLTDYILNLVWATRHPERYPRLSSLTPLISYGASPRASIYLAKAAKAHAYLESRAYVIPDDIKAIGKDVLRHRIVLSYEAEAEEIKSEEIIGRILDEIEVP
ncbi:MAG: MoxR family ATPase [Candidatus Cloacimonadaceae bacterium]|jgi:MoxR-like ATPase|nr:MoxR family ATPase [Candidatus Cloacimonadota bacterium]MDY0127053.1 MoxR family ATPase [Candidatus Cloacimonadaceae bacterium]MCB5255662.1 MoxR family ATPase [Candidatus Cloacimonadota bacterium]MCK9178455.1 MoxR family ATPase [Candidatus Cloacimonadota bacterium]MCK9242618.1 MoxR family ATPase [Candidatus Cloacimonadota bacterium]